MHSASSKQNHNAVGSDDSHFLSTTQATDHFQAILDTVEWIQTALTNAAHPLYGKVDLTKGVMLAGHSLVRLLRFDEGEIGCCLSTDSPSCSGGAECHIAAPSAFSSQPATQGASSIIFAAAAAPPGAIAAVHAEAGGNLQLCMGNTRAAVDATSTSRSTSLMQTMMVGADRSAFPDSPPGNCDATLSAAALNVPLTLIGAWRSVVLLLCSACRLLSALRPTRSRERSHRTLPKVVDDDFFCCSGRCSSPDSVHVRAGGTLDNVNTFADSKAFFNAYTGPRAALLSLRGGSAQEQGALPSPYAPAVQLLLLLHAVPRRRASRASGGASHPPPLSPASTFIAAHCFTEPAGNVSPLSECGDIVEAVLLRSLNTSVRAAAWHVPPCNHAGLGPLLAA